MIAVGSDDEGVVVFVGRFLALDIFLRNADSQSYRLALPVDGITGGIVCAPAGAQTLFVGELHRAFDVDDACGEEAVGDVLVEEYARSHLLI